MSAYHLASFGQLTFNHPVLRCVCDLIVNVVLSLQRFDVTSTSCSI